jgi:hypothetical protein
MRALLFGVAVAALPVHAQTVSPCEKLAGEERKGCIRQQEQLERERLGREEDKPQKCDALFGPEKEACLKRGGTVRARVPGSRHGG